MKRPDSVILEAISRVAFFLINLFALYLMLRGHNLPGGGFIAGLVTAISFVLLSMGLGLEDIRRILTIDPMRLCVTGLLLSALTALAPVFFGAPFFTHYFAHLHLPLLGDTEVSTALLFDLGVYGVVVGVSVKLILVLAWSSNANLVFRPHELVRYASKLELPIENQGAPGERRELPKEEARNAG